MTYLPTKPPALVTTLADANTVGVTQAGVAKTATLLQIKTFVNAGATGATGGTGSTGSTSGTGSTGSTSSGGTFVAPTGRLGTPTTTSAVKNTATSPAAVTVPTAPSRSLPAFTQASGESPRGTIIDQSNYTTNHITLADGTTIGLIATSGSPGQFTITRNGSVMSNIRLDLVAGVADSPPLSKLDDAKQLLYYGSNLNGNNVYLMTDHGLGAQTWFKLEGNGPDLDTEGDDPRVSFLVADAAAPVGDPPYGLGVHCASIGDQPRFDNWMAEFNRSIGRPSYVNGFLAFNPDFSGWGNEAYTAANNLKNSPIGPNCVPVVGMPMARSSKFGPPSNNEDFNNFINGTYDQYIKDVVKNWLNFFDQVDIRPGYEMNGTFMPWFWGGQNGDTVTPPLFVNAFKRIYTKCKEAAAEASTTAGKTKICLVTWNPCHQTSNSGPNPKTLYPGNDFCDYHGLDIYSPQYTQGRDNWSGDGAVYNQTDPAWRVAQALNPLNRIHWWDYPFASADHGPTGGEGGWGMQDAINFAKACGKPLAFPETGAGQNFADAGLGPAEDHVFPFYLRSRCDQAVNMGVPILYANIWSADERDGGWGCLFRQRVRTQHAWSSAFGGTGAALRYIGGAVGSGGSTGSTSGGSTGSTSGTTGSTGSTGSTGTSATAVVTDTSGHTATITLPPQPAAGSPPFYQSDTGLSADMYYYSLNGQLTLGCSAPGVIASIALNRNGNNIIVTDDLLGVTTYSGSTGSGSTGSTGATSGGTGIATVLVNDNSGHSATITLDAGYKTYYQNETGLALDIYYYLDSGTNKPTIGSSADGHVSSMVITRNGTTTVSSPGLAGVTTYQ